MLRPESGEVWKSMGNTKQPDPDLSNFQHKKLSFQHGPVQNQEVAVKVEQADIRWVTTSFKVCCQENPWYPHMS